MDAHLLILVFAGIITVSFAANLIAKRTNIPAVLMLMLLGFGIERFAQMGPEALLPYLEILGTIGVILIVLEASLDLHLERDKIGLIVKSTLVAAISLIASTALIAIVIKSVLGLGWILSLIYATPLSVMSSAIVIPSVGSLKKESKEFLIFESSMSDILGIIMFYALLDFNRAGANPAVIGTVGGKIILTLLLSIIISYLLILAFQSLKGGSVRLFLLIAILMGLYSAGKLLHLSPLILILVFGLALNNKEVFFPGRLTKLVNDAQFDNILKDLRFITLESAFVVRTLFFVAFGMSIVLASLLHWSVLVISVLVLLITYVIRYLSLLTTAREHIQPAVFVAPRGLITVLLFYAIPSEMTTDKFEPGIILLTVLVTSLVMTFGLVRQQRIDQRRKAARKAAAAQRKAEKNAVDGSPPPVAAE